MKTKKLYIFIAVAVVLAIPTIAVIIINHGPKTSEVNISEPNNIRDFFMSDKFRNLDPNSRRKQTGEIMQQVMTAQVQQYFELPPEKRTEYLDKIIDDMQTMRKEFRSRPRPQDANDMQRMRERVRRDFRPERMRQRSESIPPQTRAQTMEFFSAMRRRMAERGMEMRPPGR